MTVSAIRLHRMKSSIAGSSAALGLLLLAGCGGGTMPDNQATSAAVQAQPSVQIMAAVGGTAPDPNSVLPTPISTDTISYPPESFLRQVYVDGASTATTETGSATEPFKTIQAAMKGLRTGDDVIIRPGVYREWVKVPTLTSTTQRTRIRAATPRTVTIKGSVLVGGWAKTATNRVYAVSWTGEPPSQVFRGGVALAQIGGTVFGGWPDDPNSPYHDISVGGQNIWPGRVAGGVANLVPDSFTYDSGSRQLYVRLSSPLTAGETLEVSAMRFVLQAESVSALVVTGLDFEHSNTTYTTRNGAIRVSGNWNMLRNLNVRKMDGTCVQVVGNDNTLTNSMIRDCGQMGIAGRGSRFYVTNNVVSGNNTRNFNKWWEAGGMKFIGDGGSHAFKVRQNLVTANNGDGMWFDTDATGHTIEANTSAYNNGHGVHVEAAQANQVLRNWLYGNLQRGIYLSDAASNVIDQNSSFGNTLQGLAILDGGRSASDPKLRPNGNSLSNNTLAWNNLADSGVQITIPDHSYNTIADRNFYHGEGVLPKFNMVPADTYPIVSGIVEWRSLSGLDLASSDGTSSPTTTLSNQLAKLQVLKAKDLPVFLITSSAQATAPKRR